MPITTQQGRDMTAAFAMASANSGIPLRLALAVAYAESNLNEHAQRFGAFTAGALLADGLGADDQFQQLINRAWRDVSFGICQRIVAYHWAGDRTASVANVRAVREAVFSDPERDVREMCAWLADDYQRTGAADLARIGGDRALGACIIYNAGHWPESSDPYWTSHTGNVENYRRALVLADEVIASLGQVETPLPEIGVETVTIEDKAAALGDRLGNKGVPASPVCEWETTAGTMRFQQFWFAGLLEYPTEATEDNPAGREVLTMPEGTLTDEQLRQFRG